MKVFNRKWWSRIGLGVFGTLLAIQLVPYGREHANPPVTGEPTWDAPETRTLAKQACFDCHSNETEWPAYASIAPASWLVQRDVNEGRAVLNFSEWPRPQEEAKEASEAVPGGRNAAGCVHVGPCTRSPQHSGSQSTGAGACENLGCGSETGGARTRTVTSCGPRSILGDARDRRRRKAVWHCSWLNGSSEDSPNNVQCGNRLEVSP